MVSLGHDLLRARKQALIHCRLNDAFDSHPLVWRIFYELLPKEPGRPIVHAVPNMIFILKNVANLEA
jgi:hypothetical protein